MICEILKFYQKTSLLEITNKDSNMTGYRTNLHKIIAFLCTINKNTEEIKNILPFTKALEKIKYIERNKEIT